MPALIFPGQGSQVPGMGQFLFENFSQAREVFEEASDSISVDMKKLCFEGSAEELALTENTQPALVTVSVALHSCLKENMGLKSSGYAGHSVGEYAAVVAAGAMSFSEAVKAVRYRGQVMQEAVPVGQGGMLAIMGPTSQEVAELCSWVEKESGEKPISPANYNSPQQTVVSGSAKACNWLVENVKNYSFASEPRRLKCIPLKVSAPFHCDMMMPAQEKMKVFLSGIEFSNIDVPVVQNYTAEAETEAGKLKENLVLQVTGSVRWVECIQKLHQQGEGQFVECGVGKVLAGLNKKIEPSLETQNINSLEEFKKVEELLA